MGTRWSEERVLSPEDCWKAKEEGKFRHASLLRSTIAVIPLSVHGAVAHWFDNQILPAAEPQVQQKAAPVVPPEFVSLIFNTKHPGHLSLGRLGAEM